MADSDLTGDGAERRESPERGGIALEVAVEECRRHARDDAEVRLLALVGRRVFGSQEPQQVLGPWGSGEVRVCAARRVDQLIETRRHPLPNTSGTVLLAATLEGTGAANGREALAVALKAAGR